MRFRKLRIAFSATCSVACVLLIALWVRSYRGGDSISLYESNPRGVSLSSTKGRIELLTDNDINANPYGWAGFVIDGDRDRRSASKVFGGFEARHTSRFDSLSIPHWFAVALAATLAATPWLYWRFSLRTLLFATTLVAVVLGLIVWAASK
jgi:hypothetical protein